MKLTRKLLALLTALVLVLCSACACAETENVTIGIIQYVTHGSLDASREGFVQALADNGYVEGENLTLDVQNAQMDQANLSTISDRFVNNNVDLVLAIATPAAQAIAGKTTEIPILGTAITDYVVARLVESNEVPGTNVSGTSDMNPIADQIDLLITLAPEAKTIGVFYTSSEDNSVLQAEVAKEAITAAGLTYVEATITNSNDVQQVAQDLVGRCDAIYIPTDNILASSMPIVYGVTAVSKTPVVCGAPEMVVEGGLATLGISYYNLGYQTGLMALKVLSGEVEISQLPVETAASFEYTFNTEVAAEIGVEIPEDLLTEE